MTKDSTMKIKESNNKQENESRELTNILDEIIELKGELDSKLFSESKELLDEELLMMSTKIDKVIIQYYKTKYKLYS